MACPYFWPVARHDAELWTHRRRLPLGDGFRGECHAANAARVPGDDELKSACNLGYAGDCPHLPGERHADAVHFSATGDVVVNVQYVLVKDHAPAEHGTLEFDSIARAWRQRHQDPMLQHMAECYIQVWLERRRRA